MFYGRFTRIWASEEVLQAGCLVRATSRRVAYFIVYDEKLYWTCRRLVAESTHDIGRANLKLLNPDYLRATADGGQDAEGPAIL